MFSWFMSKFRRPPASPGPAAPARVWTAEDVIADDLATARMVASCMNSSSIVFGEMDVFGNLTATDGDGRPVKV